MRKLYNFGGEEQAGANLNGFVAIRAEGAALIEWEKSNFPCVTKTETDAVAHHRGEEDIQLQQYRKLAEIAPWDAETTAAN